MINYENDSKKKLEEFIPKSPDYSPYLYNADIIPELILNPVCEVITNNAEDIKTD